MHLFHKLVDALPISHYLLMRYAEEVNANPDQAMGHLVRSLYAETYHVDLHPDDLVAVCTRIEEHGDKVRARAEEASRKPKGQPQSKRKGNFSDYYNDFMAALDMTETCLWLADMDVDRARRLYFEEDYQVVEKMADFKRGYEREQHRLLFEGSLFGFGGKYGGSGSRNEGDVTVHDLSQMTSAQALERIAQMSKRH